MLIGIIPQFFKSVKVVFQICGFNVCDMTAGGPFRVRFLKPDLGKRIGFYPHVKMETVCVVFLVRNVSDKPELFSVFCFKIVSKAFRRGGIQ